MQLIYSKACVLRVLPARIFINKTDKINSKEEGTLMHVYEVNIRVTVSGSTGNFHIAHWHMNNDYEVHLYIF